MAVELPLESLSKRFRASGGIVGKYDHCICVQFAAFEAYLFGYGCVVVWGSSKQLEHVVGFIREEHAVFQRQDWTMLNWNEGDEYRIRHDDEEEEEEEEDGEDDNSSSSSSSSSETLTNPINPLHTRLPISHALAQSVKISSIDQHARRCLPAVRAHICELRTLGQPSCPRTTLVKSHFDFQGLKLDTHEIHGPSPLELSPRQREAYEYTCEILDANDRKEELQGLLEDLADMVECASEEVVNRQSLRIELIILVIIACQFFLCLVEMLHDNWKVGVITAIICVLAVTGGVVWNRKVAQRRKDYVSF